jgi:hypothetical protein
LHSRGFFHRLLFPLFLFLFSSLPTPENIYKNVAKCPSVCTCTDPTWLLGVAYLVKLILRKMWGSVCSTQNIRRKVPLLTEYPYAFIFWSKDLGEDLPLGFSLLAGKNSSEMFVGFAWRHVAGRRTDVSKCT